MWVGSVWELLDALATAVSGQRIRSLGMFAVVLRELCRAAPHAVCRDGCGDRLADLPCAGFIGALQRRCDQRVGSGG